MHRQLALLPLTGALALALASQTTVVKLLLPDTEETNPFDSLAGIRASVVSAAPTATTWALMCAPPGLNENGSTDDDDVDCGLAGATATIVAGPSTVRVQMAYSVDSTFAIDEVVDCTVKGLTESAICTGSMSESADGQISTTTIATTITGFHLQSYQLTVTGGLEKLTAAPGSSASATPSSTAGGSEATQSSASGATTLASSRVGSPQATGAAQATDAVSGSGSGNSTSTTKPAVNAAGGVNAQGALLVGAVAGVFGAVLML